VLVVVSRSVKHKRKARLLGGRCLSLLFVGAGEERDLKKKKTFDSSRRVNRQKRREQFLLCSGFLKKPYGDYEKGDAPWEHPSVVNGQ